MNGEGDLDLMRGDLRGSVNGKGEGDRLRVDRCGAEPLTGGDSDRDSLSGMLGRADSAVGTLSNSICMAASCDVCGVGGCNITAGCDGGSIEVSLIAGPTNSSALADIAASLYVVGLFSLDRSAGVVASTALSTIDRVPIAVSAISECLSGISSIGPALLLIIFIYGIIRPSTHQFRNRHPYPFAHRRPRLSFQDVARPLEVDLPWPQSWYNSGQGFLQALI